ncbi:hypothetical protein [Nodosilinea sp. FACHB-13]|uniref:hypothetical protein n=1 Tax=Cyanophyceae TaxID=3028117 RepID=UPI0016839DDD|nr:hypothetical protein [Nodosilinea sp. FACHB-13]MBD2107429.1 hypothetical protein [Nodosilinea sp. FACHB-13]
MKRWYNREVLEHFADLGPGDDLTIPRNSLRVACRHEERDSLPMTLLRVMLFEITARHSSSLHPAMFGIPIDSFESEIVYKPQVKLVFSESSADVIDGFQPVAGEVTFRIFNETTNTMTMARAQQLAQRIRSVFATPPYVWKKGTDKVVYQDKEKGYDLRILCRTETDGRALIENILDIQNDTPDWSNLNIVEPVNATERFPYNPGTKVIMGRTVRKRRQRPRVDVKFRYATLSVHGLVHPINLVDLTGVRRDPLV